MSTEYCNICGCVVPHCKHTDGHQEMAEAAMMMCGIDPAPKLPKRAREKSVYKMRSPQIVPCMTLRPDRPELAGKFVAEGFIAFNDADGKRQFHQNKTRTSLLVKIDIEAGYIETLNSIYEII